MKTLERPAPNLVDAVPRAFDAGTAVTALSALAQETRLAIFRLLIEHAPAGLTAGAIAVELDLPAPTLSFHLKELARASLVTDHREGRFVRYRAALPEINALIGYLTEHCCRVADGTVATCVPACNPATCAPNPSANRKRTTR
jgi:DNA-binding transcriptional ArsR family regulator